jgi:hypothetical protein
MSACESKDLPPISVGVSVDKMFAYRYGPYKTCSLGVWLKIVQFTGFHGYTVRKLRKSEVISGFPQPSRSCPQSLLALLWIRCLSSATGHVERGVHGVDQKMIYARRELWF